MRIKKIISATLPFLLVLLLISPSQAFAQEEYGSVNLIGCLSNLFTCGVYGLSVVVSYIGKFLVTVGVYFSKIGLKLNLNIVSSPVVQAGFKSVLVIANLAFVLGIILIAIATIFRKENYGIKKILWRLVVMAVLVNFGLILCGIVLNFSDKLTEFFISQSSPDGDFVDKIAANIRPSVLTKPPVFSWDEFGKAFLASVTGFLFTTAFSALLALAFFIMAIMLLLRYVWITLLLVLLPLAWVSWVFPDMKQYWNKWWNHFIKWAFFAPALMFFMYLAVSITNNPTGSGPQYLAQFTSGSEDSSSIAAIAGNVDKFAGIDNSTLGSLTRMILILALMFGGFFAANSLGIGMAGSVTGGAQKFGKWVGGATKRSMGRGARRAGGYMFGDTLKNTGAKLQGAGASYGALGRAVTAPIRGIGRQMTKGKEALVGGTFKEYQDKYKGWSEDERINAVAASRGIEQIALLESLKDSKRFGETVRKIPTGALADEITFEKWGKKELHKLSRNVSGIPLKEIAEKWTGVVDPAIQEDMDKNLVGIAKSLDGDKLAAFFNPYSDEKKFMDMDKDAHGSFQAMAARSMLLGGSVGKVQKILENDNPEIRNAFVSGMISSGLTWDKVEEKNKAVSSWMKGKGRQYFSDEEIDKLKIPEPQESKKAPATAGATT